MRVLIACEYSGTVRNAFASLGHDAWSCDMLPTETAGNHYQTDVTHVLHYGWDLMIAHPPCTYFAAPGMHYLKTQKDRYKKLEQSFSFLLQLWNAPIPRICIENPVGWLNTNWRKPAQIIEPFYFGDKERKKTCLWLKGLPRLNGKLEVAKNIELHTPKPDGYTKPGKDGYSRGIYFCGRINSKIGRSDQALAAHMKAKTFQGVADAMAAQWGALL